MRAPLSAEWVHLARGPRGCRVGATSRCFARQRDARLFYIWYMARPFEWCRTRSGVGSCHAGSYESTVQCTDIIADRHLRSRLGQGACDAIVIRISTSEESDKTPFSIWICFHSFTHHTMTQANTQAHTLHQRRDRHTQRETERVPRLSGVGPQCCHIGIAD